MHKPGVASGDRVNKAVLASHREGLPPQKQALLVARDGTNRWHTVNIHRTGEPNAKLRITVHDTEYPVQKVYEYKGERDDYLVYTEVVHEPH